MEQRVKNLNIVGELFESQGAEGVVDYFSFLYGAFTITLDGVVVGANDEFSELIGYEKFELFGMSVMDLIAADERAAMEARLTNKNLTHYEVKLLTKNHEIKEALASPSSFMASGKLYRLVQYIDISARIREKHLLKRAYQVVESSPVVLFVWKAELNWPVEYVSRNISQFGYSLQDFLAGDISYAQIIHPDDRERVVHEMEAYSATDVTEFNQEYRLICANGDIKWVIDRTSIKRDHSGAITHFEGIIIDNTARIQSEQSLKETLEGLRLAVNTSKLGIWELELETGQLLWNDELLNIYGLTRAGFNAEQAAWQELVHPDDRERIDTLFAQVRSGVAVSEVNFRIIRPSGDTRYIYGSATPIFDNAGNVIKLLGINVDITEFKSTITELHKSQLKLMDAQEVAGAGDFTMDIASGAIIWSKGMYKLLGYDPTDVIDFKFVNERIHHPEDLARVSKWIDDGIHSEQTNLTPNSYRLIRKDGTVIHVLARIRIERDQATPLVLFGACADITPLKQAEESLTQANRLLTDIGDLAKTGGWEIDLKTMSLFYTDQTFRIYGLPVGTPPAIDKAIEFYAPEARPLIQQAVDAAIQQNIPYSLELPFIDAYGNEKWVLTSGKAIIKNGVAERVYGSIQDITDRKLEQARLTDSLYETVNAISATVEKRDPYTSGHMARVTELCLAIAKEMKFTQEQIDGLSLASIVHDVGKINIPAEILNRPGKLSDLEFEIIKTHSQVGYDILKGITFPWPVAEIVLQHHERLDGSGYPNGLKGDEIHLEAQILAVADMLEAISSQRPYRAARGIEEGLSIVQADRGSKLNAAAVDACTKLVMEKGFTFSTAF